MADLRGTLSFSTETYLRIFSAAYQGLLNNVLLAVFALPLIVGFTVIVQPLASWPFLLLLALPCGPAIAAVFAAFSESRRTDEIAPVRQFLGGLRRTGVRALLVWGVATAVILVLAVDGVVLQNTSIGPVLAPAFILLGAVVIVLTFLVLVGLGELPSLRIRELLGRSFVVAVRQWYVALTVWAMLACIAVAFLFQPVVGILVTPSFLLFVAWAGCRRAFDRLLDHAVGTHTVA